MGDRQALEDNISVRKERSSSEFFKCLSDYTPIRYKCCGARCIQIGLLTESQASSGSREPGGLQSIDSQYFWIFLILKCILLYTYYSIIWLKVCTVMCGQGNPIRGDIKNLPSKSCIAAFCTIVFQVPKVLPGQRWVCFGSLRYWCRLGFARKTDNSSLDGGFQRCQKLMIEHDWTWLAPEIEHLWPAWIL